MGQNQMSILEKSEMRKMRKWKSRYKIRSAKDQYL